MSYPNGPDPTGGILIEYGVTGIPETYFVDRDGQLVRRWIGPIDGRQLGEAIEELLSRSRARRGSPQSRSVRPT